MTLVPMKFKWAKTNWVNCGLEVENWKNCYTCLNSFVNINDILNRCQIRCLKDKKYNICCLVPINQ